MNSSINFGNSEHRINQLEERIQILESKFTKLKEHEETVDMLLEALKNATK